MSQFVKYKHCDRRYLRNPPLNVNDGGLHHTHCNTYTFTWTQFAQVTQLIVYNSNTSQFMQVTQLRPYTSNTEFTEITQLTPVSSNTAHCLQQ
jgi:hypothetical protein